MPNVLTTDTGLSLRDLTFYVLDLPSGTSDDGAVDGLIGWERLNRFPTRINYAEKTLTFFPDGKPVVASDVQSTHITFAGKRPQVEGRIDGVAGRFTLDTGSPGSVTLATPFVASHHLVEKYHPKTRLVSAIGIGGPVYAWITRADALEHSGAQLSPSPSPSCRNRPAALWPRRTSRGMLVSASCTSSP